MAECFLPESQKLITVLARIAESRDRSMFGNKNSYSCQSNLQFCVDKIQPKSYHSLPQASHGGRIQNMDRGPWSIPNLQKEIAPVNMKIYRRSGYEKQ